MILGFDAIEDIDMRVFFNQKEMQSEKIAQWVDTTKKRLSNIYINYMIDAIFFYNGAEDAVFKALGVE